MTEKLNEISDIIEQEIEVYKKIKDLCTNKRNILIAGDLTLLEKTDNEIIAKSSEVNKYEQRREILCKELGIGENNVSISEIITYAKNHSYEEQRFMKMQETINKLVEEIKELDKINKALISKTSEIIDSTIKIITNTVYKNTCEYSNTGKKLENTLIELSSIVEEG